MNAYRDAVRVERDRAEKRLKALEATEGSTFQERRILQRELEQLEHRLIWFDRAPASWFR